MKLLILVLIAGCVVRGDLSYTVEEESIPERGSVNQCRIKTLGAEYVVMPPQTWGWTAKSSANKMSFLQPDISAGIHLEFASAPPHGKLSDRLKELYQKVTFIEEFEAVSGLGIGNGYEAEVWSTETFSFIVREAVFVTKRGVIQVRLQVTEENLEKSERAWNMVLNSLREGK